MTIWSSPSGVLRPLVLRAVDIKLDAVAVGIAEVERLAHPVVARALQGDAGLGKPEERIGQGRPRGIEDRHMVEARWCREAAASRLGSPRC